MKRFACLILAALMALSLAACGTQKRETLELFAMDTYMTFVAIGDGADDVLTDLSRTVNTLESSLSRTVDTSEVSRLNRDGSAVWDEDGAQLLSWALQHSQETDGAFDITIAPLVELWGITSDSPRVPSQEEIDSLLPLVGYEHVHQSDFAASLWMRAAPSIWAASPRATPPTAPPSCSTAAPSPAAAPIWAVTCTSTAPTPRTSPGRWPFRIPPTARAMSAP